ncbi:hypothetical protein KR054_000707, partial [Drosophila jambulina]
DAAAAGKATKDAAAAGKATKDAAAAGKATKDAAAAKASKDTDPTKSAKEADPKQGAPPPIDETAIAGGSECSPRKPIVPPPESKPKGKKKQSSSASKKKEPLTKIKGGALDCKGKADKKTTLAKQHQASRYQKYSLFLALPLIAILTLLIFSSRVEEDRLEFKKYGFLYKRDKRFSFGDGKRSAFHNSYYNALPPDGYEDEIDEEGLGLEPETEKEKKSRLKEFKKVFKKWKKHAKKRDAQMRKEMAAAQTQKEMAAAQ